MNDTTVIKYKLSNAKAKQAHSDICHSSNSYSLTITLNPWHNSLPVNEQYNKLSRELVKVFSEMGNMYNVLMMTPEFTKDYNIHFHVYFELPREADHICFEQNWKKYMSHSKVIGRNYRLKKIDEITDALLNYPFKDTERTLRYSQITNCLFTPHHFVMRYNNNIFINKDHKIDNNKYLTTINKFIEFVNSQKNI